MYAGLTLEEIDHEIQKTQLSHKRVQGIQLQNAIDYDSSINAILAEAHAQKNIISTKNNRIDTKNIKKNRKKEAEAIREEQTSPPKDITKNTLGIIDFHPSKAYTYGDIFASIEEEDL